MSESRTTPGQTVGPFFHYALPYDGDSHLVAPGTAGALVLTGRVFDGAGDPIPDALIEIRQADSDGVVPRVESSLHRDDRFTGWGRCATDSVGRYRFLTLAPGNADGGAAFFSVVVFARGLLTQLHTRAYLPESNDAFLEALDAAGRRTLLTTLDDDGSLRFDIHLQGASETVFIDYPGHRR